MARTIGFIGLGTMGFPMALNLNKAGFEVIGYDAFRGTIDKAKSAGITMVDTLKEVAEQSTEAVISMVRDYAQTVDVIFGDRGLLSAGSTGRTIIVMSTLDPESMNALGERVESESGFKLVSAAVSGGASGAAAGTLSIMTSGSEEIVTGLQPIFEAMGSNVFFYGNKPGNSQAAKLVNNMILGININAVAEGLRLSNSFGLPEAELFNLLKVSTGDSWVVRHWPDIAEWTADTALSVLLKDLKAAYHEGLDRDVALPFNALSSTALFGSMGKKPKPS